MKWVIWLLIVATINITGARSSGATIDQLGWFPGGRMQTFSGNGRTMRSAGTFSNLYMRVTANAVTGSSVVDFRINLVDTLILLTVPATTTGEFEGTDSASVAAGDEVRIDLDHGDLTNAITFSAVNILFAATTNTVCVPLMCNSGSLSTNNTNFFYPIAGFGGGGGDSTEANSQYKAKTAGTAKNLFVNVDTNSRSQATTADLRKGAASTALTISITASTTGFFEDTANTDSVAVDALINYRIRTAGGTGSIRVSHFSVEFETTNTAWPLIGGETLGHALATSTTYFYTVGGGFFQSTTELNTRADADVAFTWSKLTAYVSANGITATTTVRNRINGANGNQSLSIGSGATGNFEDASNTDSVVASDEMNYSIVTGGTGTTLTLNQLASLGQITVSAAARKPSMTLLGVGI